jgi:hypothetical protein
VQVTKLSELGVRLMLQRDSTFFALMSHRVDISLKDAIVILSGSQFTLLRHLLRCVTNVLKRQKLSSADEKLDASKVSHADDEDMEDLGEVTQEFEATLEDASSGSVIMDNDSILDMKNRFEFSLGKLHLEVVDDAEVHEQFEDEEQIQYFNNKNVHTVGKTNLIVIFGDKETMGRVGGTNHVCGKGSNKISSIFI